jgi:DNA polymerase-1
VYKDKTLVLVDGSSLAFRSFFALFTTGLRTKDGVPTWAILGFFNSLFEIIEKYSPDMLAVSFDMAAPTFRHVEFEDYKAHRAEMPDDLAVQWPILKQGVEVLGLPVYELEGFEADDVIGTLARLAETEHINVLILTGDQDAFQLLDGSHQRIKVLMPGKGGLQVFGREQVFEKLSIWPEQVTDYKGLCGDTSDNIPGIKGIGPKTAVQLLDSYKDMDGIYANIHSMKASAMRQKLIDGETIARASKNLATIRFDVPLKFDFEHCSLTAPNLEAVSAFFSNLEFRALVGRLPRVFKHFRVGSAEPANGQVIVGAKEGSEYATATKHASGTGGLIGSAQETGARNSIEPDQSTGAQYDTGSEPSVGSRHSTGSEQGVSNNQLKLFLSEPEAKSATLTEKEAEVESISTSGISFECVTNVSQLEQLTKTLASQTLICIDIETTGDREIELDALGYSFAWHDSLKISRDKKLESASHSPAAIHIAYVPISNVSLLNTTSIASEIADSLLAPLLLNEGIGKSFYNVKSALKFFAGRKMSVKSVVFDPMLASYVVFPDERHGLREQAERILNYSLTVYDANGKLQKLPKPGDMPPHKLAEFAAMQAQLLFELTSHYVKIMDSDQWYLFNEMELPLSMVLAKMEQVGIALDLPYLRDFSEELNKDILRLEQAIFTHARHPFNINSPLQLQKVLFEELGLKTKAKTKTGYSTDASVLEALKEDHDIIPSLLEYRQLTKLKSTYVDALPKLISQRDGRLHGEFNQTATSTGRLSSSNPNLQNIPIRTELGRRMRRTFIPGNSGSLILSADYSQIELRLLAVMSKDETLIDAFLKNQDVHARTASEIFDTPIDSVTADMRRIGKTLNFALIYQQGAFSTGQSLGISTKEAAAFIEKYFKRLARVRAFMDETIDKARKDGYVETLWKRRRYFKFLNDRNEAMRKADERAACNAPLQGSAADLMKLAMIRLDRELSKRQLNAKLILQVHDELVLEVPQSEIDQMKAVVIESMLMDQPFQVPLKVDVGVGTNWRDAK